jgi:hypothetical protein
MAATASTPTRSNQVDAMDFWRHASNGLHKFKSLILHGITDSSGRGMAQFMKLNRIRDLPRRDVQISQ